MDAIIKAEYDKLIGEFMGYENIIIDSFYKKAACYVEAPNGWKEQFPQGVHLTLDYLVWNNLMPVIEKIENVGGNILITTDIESTFLRVVEYLKK